MFSTAPSYRTCSACLSEIVICTWITTPDPKTNIVSPTKHRVIEVGRRSFFSKALLATCGGCLHLLEDIKPLMKIDLCDMHQLTPVHQLTPGHGKPCVPLLQEFCRHALPHQVVLWTRWLRDMEGPDWNWDGVLTIVTVGSLGFQRFYSISCNASILT